MVSEESSLNTCLSDNSDLVDRGLKRVSLFITRDSQCINGFLESRSTGSGFQRLLLKRFTLIYRCLLFDSVLYLTVATPIDRCSQCNSCSNVTQKRGNQ